MKQIFGIAIFVFVFPFSVLAETSVEGLLDKVDRLYRSDSSHATMEMKIVTENWERTTVMEVWSRGMNDTLIKILSPRKDKGIKTLKLGNQMWNYFPKINKVLKVPPSMMMNSWMGSDFTNDDLVKENTLAEDYHAKLEEHPSDPNQFYFIVLRPKNGVRYRSVFAAKILCRLSKFITMKMVKRNGSWNLVEFSKWAEK